ncbi:MAG: Nramp family divalent metal transporter [Chitinophagales bacterium]|nr:Nramp family divalent metal transporter [Chitinophagales bacterium]
MSRHRSLEEVHASIDTTRATTWGKRLLLYMGPAFLVAVGYMDPGNWATDIEGGSRFGYKLLWVLLMSNLIALLMQSLSARLGIVSGRDLAQACRETYPAAINLPLWVLAEIAIAACDLAEVLGMAIGLKLLFGLPLLWGVALAVTDTLIILYLQKRGMRYMEAVILSMVGVIGFSFLIEMIFAHPELDEVTTGFVPSALNGYELYVAIGIIGATVMPHNLYLHSSLVQTRRSSVGDEGKRQAIRFNLIDSTVALNLAFLVNASILILAATVFYKRGLQHVVTIEEAHSMLQPLLGRELAPILFAVALIAAGQSSTITGTLAGQIVMEGFLDLRLAPWLRRLITRLVAVVPALLVLSVMGEGYVEELLVLSQVILSMQLGFAVVPLIHFVSDKTRMGHFALSLPWKIIAWLCASVIILLNLKLVLEKLFTWHETMRHLPWVYYGLVLPVSLSVVALLFIVIYYAAAGKSKTMRSKSTPHKPAAEIPVIPSLSYQKVAICVDFSSHDIRAITEGMAHGAKDTQFYLLHVVESAGAHSYGEHIYDSETDDDLQQLQKYVNDLEAQGYRVTPLLGFGKPHEELARMCRNVNAELLVMARHGHSGIMGYILGETIGKVRHRVKCKVLVV